MKIKKYFSPISFVLGLITLFFGIIASPGKCMGSSGCSGSILYALITIICIIITGLIPYFIRPARILIRFISSLIILGSGLFLFGLIVRLFVYFNGNLIIFFIVPPVVVFSLAEIASVLPKKIA